jgi:hypothetical protein
MTCIRANKSQEMVRWPIVGIVRVSFLGGSPSRGLFQVVVWCCRALNVLLTEKLAREQLRDINTFGGLTSLLPQVSRFPVACGCVCMVLGTLIDGPGFGTNSSLLPPALTAVLNTAATHLAEADTQTWTLFFILVPPPPLPAARIAAGGVVLLLGVHFCAELLRGLERGQSSSGTTTAYQRSSVTGGDHDV